MWDLDSPSGPNAPNDVPASSPDFDLEQTVHVIVVGTKTGKLSVAPHDHHRRTPDPTPAVARPESPAGGEGDPTPGSRDSR